MRISALASIFGTNRLELKRNPVEISSAILGAAHATLLNFAERLKLIVISDLLSLRDFLGSKYSHPNLGPDIPFFSDAVWIAAVVDETRHGTHERCVNDELVGHVEKVAAK